MAGEKVNYVFTVDTRVIPIWNTLGVIPGYIKDEVVIVGNHRDGADLSDFYIIYYYSTRF